MDTIKEGIKWAAGLTHVPLKKEWTNLLDADFTHWDKFIGVPHTSVSLPDDVPKSDDVRKGTPLGLNNDPLGVFTMIKEGGADVLKINGQIYGGLTSKQEYENYHLKLEFRWGEKKWEPRLERQRDNGLLYHCTGPHGGFWNVWMSSLELQIQERDMGDLFLLAGPSAWVRTTSEADSKFPTFRPDGDRTKAGRDGGKGRIIRSSNEEMAHGEWNTIELYTFGDRAVHLVNGKVVNAIDDAYLLVNGKEVPLVRGKIQLQSEAADAFFRRVRIKSIDKIPAEILKQAGF